MIGRWAGHLFVAMMRALSHLPLRWVRAVGTAFGWLLWVLARPRRRVVLTNLRLCFPAQSPAWHERVGRESMRLFAQSWMDRAWLWHAPDAVVRRRLRLTGEVHALLGSDEPAVVFSPHFYGLDAGWTALTQQIPRHWSGIYADQANVAINDWIYQGRGRFGQPRMASREESTKSLARALRAGDPLYILPDTNHGVVDPLFVPFYGIAAATAPSLARFARMGRARVVPVITRLTPQGYDIEVQPPWTDVPSGDDVADTALMNLRLQAWIDRMPEQYWWVAKRFKLRPPGEPAIY